MPFLKQGLLKGTNKLEVTLFAETVRHCLKSAFFFFFPHRDSEIMQQKQKAANERKSLQAGGQ